MRAHKVDHVRKALPVVSLWLATAGMAGVCAALEIEAPDFTARFERGALVGLTDAGGAVLVEAAGEPAGAAIHLVDGDHYASSVAPTGADGEAYGGFEGLEGARITATYAVDEGSGDVVISQHAESPRKGLWGVGWTISNVPLDMNVIVPGHSGLRLTRTTPGASFTFDYPIAWEAQLVILEGAGRGFYVWTEDARGRFKRLRLERSGHGWRLEFITMPYAPFDERSTCDSVPWRLNVYEGDWRVPARRYRDWMVQAFRPTPVAEQTPEWVRDVRCCVIMGLDQAVLDALPARLDASQTILYVPSWRKAGYDRDYPTYDEPFDTLDPFIERAHELGFRVMLHVNYFGCDPLNPLYEQFEPYQCRSPWGDHEKDWWLWTRADPIIKFAYINPAHKPWRDLFVARMVALCETHDVDALHLDQTLCIYNDHNGLMDGVSMIEGNVALHRELRAALPHVALSGEGLNEVTYRHEALAQRHAWGINHSDGTFSRPHLAAAHPIGSYLLRPYTTIYGYLGCAPPTSGQMYSAWNEVYQHMGVIPTLKPNRAELDNPTGFSRQFFTEAACWLENRVDVDTDAPWPPDVAFPFRAADGTRVVRTADRRLLLGDREISRTITGVTEVWLPGSIPGWYAYDEERIIGLDPGSWYPYLPAPRDHDALHVASLPEGFTLTALAVHDDLAFVRTGPSSTASIRLAERIHDAQCGSRHFQAGADIPPTEGRGDLHAPDGAFFVGHGDNVHAHPPFRIPGSGVAFARFDLDLPEDVGRFAAEVLIDSGAVGEDRSDGVTFGACVRAGDREARAELHTATSERKLLALDLAPFAGARVALELTVAPGPGRSPTYDWARWLSPRIERAAHLEADLALAGTQGWRVALAGHNATRLPEGAPRVEIAAAFPGAVYLLRSQPDPAPLPLAVDQAPYQVTFVGDTGVVLDAPPHACAQRSEGTIGGVPRHGLFTHPPDHGRTIVDVPMTLPEAPASFHAFVGLRDGAESAGVVFVVEANGVELARRKVLPGAWQDLSGDLSAWAGRPVVLSLVTDSAGDYICDWAHWGEPRVQARGTPGVG